MQKQKMIMEEILWPQSCNDYKYVATMWLQCSELAFNNTRMVKSPSNFNLQKVYARENKFNFQTIFLFYQKLKLWAKSFGMYTKS